MPPPQDGASTNFATRALQYKVFSLSKVHFKLKTFNLLKDVPEERLELSRDNSQRLLRPQRLPISPSGHSSIYLSFRLKLHRAANILFSTKKHSKNIIIDDAL